MATTPLEAEPEPSAIDPCGTSTLGSRAEPRASTVGLRFDRLIKASRGIWGCVSTGEKVVRALA
jgi:hypothetical protein